MNRKRKINQIWGQYRHRKMEEIGAIEDVVESMIAFERHDSNEGKLLELALRLSEGGDKILAALERIGAPLMDALLQLDTKTMIRSIEMNWEGKTEERRR